MAHYDDEDDLFDDLTPVQRRRLKSSIRINDTPADRISYQHTVLCQTCLPYRNPGESVRIWERQQGAISLAVEAGRVRDPRTQKFVEVGLPYGSRPRMILAHLNREALLRRSPRIEVESSLTAFVKRVVPENSSPRGVEIRRFKDQLTRFAAALVRMAVSLPNDRGYHADTKIIDFMELWGGKDGRQRALWPAVVEAVAAISIVYGSKPSGALAGVPGC